MSKRIRAGLLLLFPENKWKDFKMSEIKLTDEAMKKLSKKIADEVLAAQEDDTFDSAEVQA